MFNPATISQAYALAKIQEANLLKQKVKPQTKPPILPTPYTSSLNKSGPILPLPKNQNTPPKQFGSPFNPNQTRRTLSPAEFDERRSKGLCFFCDEKYEFGHRCKGKRPQLYHLELEDGEEEPTGKHEEEVDNEFSHISINALAGITDYQTLRITGHYGKRALQMLLDTGSTHNFIDSTLAKKLGCKLVPKPSMIVRVADGGKVACDTMIEGFQWKMQAITFTDDLYLLPLGVCDVVLGIQWFTSLGRVHFDFLNHTIDLLVKGSKVTLRGATGKGIKTVSNSKMGKCYNRKGSYP